MNSRISTITVIGHRSGRVSCGKYDKDGAEVAFHGNVDPTSYEELVKEVNTLRWDILATYTDVGWCATKVRA